MRLATNTVAFGISANTTHQRQDDRHFHLFVNRVNNKQMCELILTLKMKTTEISKISKKSSRVEERKNVLSRAKNERISYRKQPVQLRTTTRHQMISKRVQPTGLASIFPKL